MEAAVWRQDKPVWTNEDERAAQIVEAINWQGYEVLSGLILMAGGKPSLPEPQRIQHPDRPEPVKPKPELVTDPDEIANFFGMRRKEVKDTP